MDPWANRQRRWDAGYRLPEAPPEGLGRARPAVGATAAPLPRPQVPGLAQPPEPPEDPESPEQAAVLGAFTTGGGAAAARAILALLEARPKADHSLASKRRQAGQAAKGVAKQG